MMDQGHRPVLDARRYVVRPTCTIKEALKQLDHAAEKTLLVVNEEECLVGALSDGDIRRALLAGRSFDECIEGIFNYQPVSIATGELNIAKIRELMLKHKVVLVPVVDPETRRVIEVHSWSEILAGHLNRLYAEIDVPVVVMAGGKGSRLAPFTNILPKPLIPLGELTVIEKVLETFHEYGTNDFRIILNFKGEMIRAYFAGTQKPFSISFIEEKEYQGTAGSIALLKGKLSGSFIVSNCDILVKADYSEIMHIHEREGSAMTIVSSIQHHRVPYGVIEFGPGGVVQGIREKPEYTHSVNTGVYVLSQRCFDYIPKGRSYDMTDLISDLLRSKEKVTTYPVNESDYSDIGQWKEYKHAVEQLNSPFEDKEQKIPEWKQNKPSVS